MESFDAHIIIPTWCFLAMRLDPAKSADMKNTNARATTIWTLHRYECQMIWYIGDIWMVSTRHHQNTMQYHSIELHQCQNWYNISGCTLLKADCSSFGRISFLIHTHLSAFIPGRRSYYGSRSAGRRQKEVYLQVSSYHVNSHWIQYSSIWKWTLRRGRSDDTLYDHSKIPIWSVSSCHLV